MRSEKLRKGFTLIEMLVVIGIIAVLIAASIGGYSKITKTAENSNAQNLVQQVALALSTMYEQDNGRWPLRMASVGEKGGELDELVAYAFVSGDTKYLSLSHSGGKLTGYDRFGVLDPWGVAIAKRKGDSVTLADVQKHRLWFAVDADGDGVIKGANVGGASVSVRATAIVWSAGKDGVMDPYQKGLQSGGIYSWTPGQTKGVE